MKILIPGRTVAVLTLTAGLSFTVIAQAQPTYKSYCQTVGTAPLEPIGDRAGHAISAATYTCRVEGGPMDGSVMTGSQFNEWDGPNAIGRGGFGISRKAGASLIFSLSGQKTALIMVDGKVTGSSGSGRGTYALGSGSASALSGKGFSYVTKNVGFNQFVIETTDD